TPRSSRRWSPRARSPRRSPPSSSAPPPTGCGPAGRSSPAAAGMRSVGVARDRAGVPRLHLNGRPYFQAGVLDQGYWPDGLYTPPSDAALVHDIKSMKDLGFTMLRQHIKIAPLRWYHHCDRLGMLVWQDFVNGGGRYRPEVV